MLTPLGMTGAYRVNGERVTPEKLHTTIAHIDYLLTAGFEDGFLDHQEKTLIKQELRSLINHAVSFISSDS